MEKKLIVLTGFSSSGKDTILKILSKELNLKPVISTTTRPIRLGEVDGVDYNFKTEKEFKNLIKNDDLIEYREYHTLVNGIPDTWYYGVEKSAINNTDKYIVVLDILGLNNFKKYFDNVGIISFFINVDDEIRMNRCKERKDYNAIEWNRRLLDDKDKFKNVENYVNFIIDNNSDNIYDCVEKIKNILKY